jgi:GTPase SAR1 family protein
MHILTLTLKQQKPGNKSNLHSVMSTIGIDIERINLGGGDVTIWDFAGQIEYTATHQFFLSTEVQIYFYHLLLLLHFIALSSIVLIH